MYVLQATHMRSCGGNSRGPKHKTAAEYKTIFVPPVSAFQSTYQPTRVHFFKAAPKAHLCNSDARCRAGREYSPPARKARRLELRPRPPRSAVPAFAPDGGRCRRRRGGTFTPSGVSSPKRGGRRGGSSGPSGPLLGAATAPLRLR